jgi:pyruvate,water dikinase
MVVQGAVTPDEYVVFKDTLGQNKPGHGIKQVFNKQSYHPIINKKLGFKNRKMVYSTGEHPTKIVPVHQSDIEKWVLSDKEILLLASWAVEIEKHYTEKHGKWTPMDMEWAKDGQNGKLYIVQARPETIHSTRNLNKVKQYTRTNEGKVLVKGASVGNKIAVGETRVIFDPSGIKQFKAGEVLVTEITDPDWEPIMKIASAIVTDKGGRTSHAAIVSRELGIPCIVGSENATKVLKTGQMVTVDTTGAEGMVFDGKLDFKVSETDLSHLPKTKTHIMINIATPETAFEKSFLPNHGVGLAREEFIIASNIGIHPMALINYDQMSSEVKNKIDQKTLGYANKIDFYVDNLAYGIATIAAAFYPNQILVRLSDFKTNEYRTLIGGDQFEPEEENPMIMLTTEVIFLHNLNHFSPLFRGTTKWDHHHGV